MALPTASDNPFPSLLVTETAAASIGSPAAGKQRLFVDTDHVLKYKDSGGTVSNVSTGGGGGGLAADAWTSVTGLSYSSADAPTFVIATASDLSGTIPIGARIKLTQTTAKFFIVTAISSSTITVYGGTDYTLANATITSPYYSLAKVPFGFPADPVKWRVEVTDTADQAQASPTSGTWYNLGSITISIPIGCWRVHYDVLGDCARATALGCSIGATLSTANNSQSDATMTYLNQNSPLTRLIGPMRKERFITATSKTSYFLNSRTYDTSMSAIDFRGDLMTTVIRAICAYL